MSIKDWLSEMPYQETLQILDDLGLRMASKAGGVGALLAGYILRRDYASIVEYEVDYTEDWDVLQLLYVRQILGLYSKLEPLDLNTDKEAVAFRKFVQAEQQCLATNQFFRGVVRNRVSLPPDVVVPFFRARRKIARVLGDVPTVESLVLRFGPKSTASIRKSRASFQAKLAETPTCSDELLHSYFFPGLLRSMPGWLNCHQVDEYIDEEGYEVAKVDVCVSKSRLEFVPKNAKTFRSIDVQPTLNTLVQGAIGDYMSERLRMVGVSVRDQAPNQRAARKGSIDNSLSTIDLQSASDTVSRELVRALLPSEWYSLLQGANCGTTVYKGLGLDLELPLEKFSSMGNGFTFPLETLIFWALTSSVCEDEVGQVLAYGDDIICPSSRYNDVVRILGVCGFTVNTAKSFHVGAFRESCGADYYNGIDVRPYYQKTLITGETLFTMHNYFYRHLDFEMAAAVLGYIPEPLRLFGPDGYGDGHLLGEWPSYRTREIRRSGFGGVLFDSFRRCSREAISIYPGDYVTPLYSIYRKGGRNDVSPIPYWTLRWRETLPRTLDWVKHYERPDEVKCNAQGRPCWPVPGADAYEKISIYTFSPC